MNLRIYSTGPSPASTTRSSSISCEEIKKAPPSESILTRPLSKDVDIEKKQASAASSLYAPVMICQGRPDIAAIITDIVSNADKYNRIAVAACGPDGMTQVTRQTVAKNIMIDGPSLELHYEQFGW